MSRATLADLAKHFDFSNFDKDLKNAKPYRIVDYGTYMERDEKIHQLTGLYIDELIEKLAAGWHLVPPDKPMTMSELMKGDEDDQEART